MKRLVYDTGKSLLLLEDPTELTGDQLIYISKILHGSYSRLQASLLALKVLSGLNFLKFYFLPADVKEMCLVHTQWVLEDFTISEQLIPVYKKYYGPKRELDNLKLGEFYFSEKYYTELIADNDETALNKLVAVLYRKAKSFYNQEKDRDGDIRVKFNGHLIDYNCKVIAKWPLVVKQAILLFYDGCRKKIQSDHPAIFTGTATEGDNDADMFGIMRNLAGGRHGDFEKVEDMYLHTGLMELDMIIAENKRAEDSIKK